MARSNAYLLVPGSKWKVKDLTGKTFGRLTVLGQYPVRHKNGNARWVVECSCGTVKIVRSCHLVRGTTISCGCWTRTRLERHSPSHSRAMFLSHMIDRYRKHAHRRNLSWNLTDEQFDELMKRDCFFCGVPPQYKNKQGGNAGLFLYNGVDRLVNHLGYFPENCVPCCGTCNVAKKEMSAHDFVKWATRVAEHNKNAD